MKEDIAEIIGIQMGDGCLSYNGRYHMHYIGGDIKEEKEYHDLWVSKLFNKYVMRKLGKSELSYKEYSSTGVYGSYNFDKEVVEFFQNFGLKCGSKLNQDIPNFIKKDPKCFRRFIRGMFDTDGNIYFDKNRSCKYPINNVPVIKLSITSKKVIDDIFYFLMNNGYHPRLKSPYKGKRDKNFVYSLLLYRRDDVRCFIKEIGFKNPKHFSKWEVFLKFGYLIPRTTLIDRRNMLRGFDHN